MSVERSLCYHRSDRRVLSIQSHVVSGYAGNKCAIFPLQLHGFVVDFINSVQYSNHKLYAHGAPGQKLSAADLAGLFQGLVGGGLNKTYSHILTGFTDDAEFLRQVAVVVRECRKQRPDLIYVCDPVMGDNGRYYVPRELRDVFWEEILPLANVITPNAFELSELSGMPVNTEKECLQALRLVQSLRDIRIAVMTSGLTVQKGEDGSGDLLNCYASEMIDLESGQFRQYRFSFPHIRGNFVGTGDLFSALLLTWLEKTEGNVATSVRTVLVSLQTVLRSTSAHAFAATDSPGPSELELRLVECRLELLQPKDEQIIIKSTQL